MRVWLERDPALHVYVLAPSRASAGYDPATLLADRERVTVLEAEPPADLAERTAAYTDDGRPLPEQESRAFVDLVYTLRALWYADQRSPGTPVFRRADAAPHAR